MTPRRKYEHSFHSHGSIHASIVPSCGIQCDDPTGTQTGKENQGPADRVLVRSGS